MKKKTILGVALTLMLLGSLVAATVPISAKTLGWSSYTIPSSSNYVLDPGTDVLDIAVFDEDTVFAALGDNYIYKSTDRGVKWSRYATDNDTDLVAVALDDSEFVIYADTTEKYVFISDDGGSSFDSLGIPEETGTSKAAATITDIAISVAKSGTHYIAVAGIETGGTVGNIWYYDVGATAPAWTEINDKVGFSTVDGTSVVAAVEFSPNFASDEVLAALVETDSEGVTFELFSFDSKLWNESAGFIGYEVDVVAETNVTDLLAGSITLDPDYLGSDDAMRMAFVGLDIEGATTSTAYNGIYRVDDTLVKAIKDGASLKMSSVAYNGSTLVAGRSDLNTTYYSADPTATTPTVTPSSTYKRPANSGCDTTIVAWAGDVVVAGTSGDESAFSISRNDGKSYNDISLVDTGFAYVADVAVSPDGSTVYLATSNETDARFSLWREASGWERVLAISDKADFLIRIAPDDADVVYVADKGATTIYYSADSGETRWQLRSCGVSIQDLAVESDGDIVYALDGGNGKVTKSTNSGFTWGLSKDTKLTGGNMLISLGEEKLLAGSDNGYVSYSIDSGSTWTKITKQIASDGTNVQAVASGTADGDFIYAAAVSDDPVDIRRWEIGDSTVWTDIKETVSGNVTGMVLQGKVFYAMAALTGDSTAYRTTNATLDPTVYWSTMASTALFNVTPQALSVGGGGSNKLWAIDTETDALYSYTDTLIDLGPTLVSPKQDFVLKVNQVVGKPYDVTFAWERPSDNVEAYELKLAFDSGFDEEIASITVDETGTPISKVVGPGTVSFFEAPDETYVSGTIEFMPDTTYFWRVRVSSPIKSQYSEVRRFTTEPATVTPPVIVQPTPPAPPAPKITVTVPPPVKVEIPPAPPAPAPITPAYIWAVIIIGAIMVIALIILIVRTRRAV